jgi:hypothetical protein
MSTQRDEQSKHSKMRSLWRWLQQIAIFPSNCGINLHRRSKTHSIYCVLQELTQLNWHMKSSMDHTTGTGTPWPHSDAKPSSTKMATHVVHGHPEDSMRDTLDHPRTITPVIFITSLKPKLTIYLGQQNCSRNTANFPT